MKKRIAAVTIIVGLFILATSSVVAETIQPMYTSITSFSCSLNVSAGNAECMANVQPTSREYSSSLSMSLKRSVNGINWTTVKSWTKTGSGLPGVTIEESTAVSSGYKYRVTVTATIKNANGIVIETASKSSRIIEH